MKFLTLLSLCAASAALVCAGDRRLCSTPPAQHVADVQTQVVPAYGAVPYQLLGAPGMSQADGKRIVELLESIDRRLESVEGKVGGGPLALKKGPDLFAVAKANCAACHTAATADRKGDGFVLFADDENSLKPLSGREKRAVEQAVKDGLMPKGRKLTADEKSVFKW